MCGSGSLWWCSSFLLFWSTLGEMCPIWGMTWSCLVLQRLPLDKMRHEPVTLIMKGIVTHEPGSNIQGTVAQHRDSTKWLVSSLFIHPCDSRIAAFPNPILFMGAQRYSLGLLSVLSPATDRDTDASQIRSACVSKDIQQSDSLRELRWYCMPIQ
jgi:hypothetical protein